ncbi:MAG: hypothetical protein VKJ64_10910 [Leptolyngbyaceae bacterium]|nr:hypothetical protein [Leptolyngbyaceae bacterium]
MGSPYPYFVSDAMSQREQKIQAGIEALDQWLQDLMHRGLASVQSLPDSVWEDMAARMVDAQAPGLARRLRDCSRIPYSGEGWGERLLVALGKLYLLVQGYQGLATLPTGLQAEVRTQIGWTLKKDEVLAIAHSSTLSPNPIPSPHPIPSALEQPLPWQQADQWQVLGIRVLEDDQLWSQRVWLWGIGSDRPALLLNFSYGSPRFDHQGITLVPGIILPATLAFYPSSYPLRSLIQEVSGSAKPMGEFACGRELGGAIAQFNQAISHNPWLDRMPLIFSAVIPVKIHENWWMINHHAQGLPIHPQFPQQWELLAISGGAEVAIAAEWDGTYLWPLSVSVDQRLILLAG